MVDQVQRLKELEKENYRLRKAVGPDAREADLKEAASGNFRAPPAVATASTISADEFGAIAAQRDIMGISTINAKVSGTSRTRPLKLFAPTGQARHSQREPSP